MRWQPPSPKLRRALRLAGWNALLLIAGLVLIGLAGEAWRRSTAPFVRNHESTIFVPGVGVMLRPDSEVRWTNGLDFWVVSRTNHLGFLDREPPSPARTAESCHITMVGDSFVNAREVPIPEKFHVRLEEMAARELPALDVTTSAFGRSGTGQINQLAYYDEYVRPLRPKLVVLVFVINDFVDNFPLLVSLRRGLDPEHLPHVSAARAEDGSFRLRPPDPDYQRFMLPTQHVERPPPASWFLWWLRIKLQLSAIPGPEREIRAQRKRVHWMKLLGRRPAYALLLDEWLPASRETIRSSPIINHRFHALFTAGNDSAFFTEALAFTAFGLDEFKKRTERDGAALVVLTSHKMRRYGDGALAWLNGMAAERGIPVIDLGGFIRRQGAELRDAQWPHDGHWNPVGHRWAAQALLEYLKENQDACG